MSLSLSRRTWLGLAAGAAVLVAAHGALWWAATSRMEQALRGGAERMRAAGWTVSYAPPQRVGWPVAAGLEIADWTASGPVGGLPGGLEWHAARLRGLWQPTRPREFALVMEGEQILRLGMAPPVAIAAANLEAILPLRPPGQARGATLEGTQVQLRAEGGSSVTTLETLHGVLEEAPALAGAPAARTLRLATGTIFLPPLADGHAWALGNRISTLSLELSLSGPVGQGGGRREAEAWREAGGDLAIRNLALAWGPMTLTASADLGLDAGLQPAGKGTIELAGYEATINALVSAGVMTPRAAVATRGVAALLARPGADGQPSTLSVPLRLQDRVLSAGNFALTRLPPWTWPED